MFDHFFTTPGFKKTIHWLGHLLAVASVCFIGFKLFKHIELVSLRGLVSTSLIINTFLLALAYAFNLFLLVFGWRHIILAEEGELSLKASLMIYGKSQIAKYLPGNIFHLAGRQWLGSQYGLSQTILLKSSLWEIGLIAIAAVLIGLTSLANLFTTFSAMILLMLIMIIGIAYVLTEFFKTGYVKAFYAYLIFHIIAGLLFAVVLNLIDGNVFNQPASLAICISAYVLAWLVGFVTPGVPGGVGVREMVILILLGHGYAEQTLLIALIVSRIVTTLGDLLLFIAVSTNKSLHHQPLETKQSLPNA
jgi:hypothetical protein